MPFGRTDVLIGANGAPSPELSYGNGLKGASFHGFSKVVIFLIVPNWERKLEKKRSQIWSYRGLDTTMLKLFSRSGRWAWFHGYRGQTKINKMETYT